MDVCLSYVHLEYQNADYYTIMCGTSYLCGMIYLSLPTASLTHSELAQHVVWNAIKNLINCSVHVEGLFCLNQPAYSASFTYAIALLQRAM